MSVVRNAINLESHLTTESPEAAAAYKGNSWCSSCGGVTHPKVWISRWFGLQVRNCPEYKRRGKINTKESPDHDKVPQITAPQQSGHFNNQIPSQSQNLQLDGTSHQDSTHNQSNHRIFKGALKVFEAITSSGNYLAPTEQFLENNVVSIPDAISDIDLGSTLRIMEAGAELLDKNVISKVSEIPSAISNLDLGPTLRNIEAGAELLDKNVISKVSEIPSAISNLDLGPTLRNIEAGAELLDKNVISKVSEIPSAISNLDLGPTLRNIEAGAELLDKNIISKVSEIPSAISNLDLGPTVRNMERAATLFEGAKEFFSGMEEKYFWRLYGIVNAIYGTCEAILEVHDSLFSHHS